MNKEQLKQFVASRIHEDGMVDTGVKGVQLFRVTEPVHCAPAIYEPGVVAILSGSKEAILDGARQLYDSSRYLCCSLSMPVEAGAPTAAPDNPLLGVYIALDTSLMTELAIAMENAAGALRRPTGGTPPQGIALARWDEAFSDALWRVLQLSDQPVDRAVLAEARLRELYYAVLKGEAGASARRAFGVGNEIARAVEYLSSRLTAPVTIDEVASQVGMSRAVFHRKFKQATRLSPLQFVKAMRLNRAAMKIAAGRTVYEAAQEVGYQSSSQFSREFRRMYGTSPKQWSRSRTLPAEPERSAGAETERRPMP